MKHPAPAPRRRQAGFALLITITLLAFLVLLLVSLSALTRVETRVASNSQQLSQARQNALMALNVALGRLQASAGPDTRATATADLISGRHIDKKNWTGVWNASAASADKNIAWLVSGTAPAGSSGVTGALTAASGNTLVELVGAGSTDISNQAATGNRVQVETQPITSASVPGMTGTQIIGNFAYWVGDEGVKAKVSVTDPWETTATLEATTPHTPSAQAQNYRFINAQRLNIEKIQDPDDTVLGTTAYPSADPAFKASLSKILSLDQFPLATPAASQSRVSATLRSRFHDLTALSYSLLTDTARGGMKKDLTAWINESSTTPNPSTPPAPEDDYINSGDPSDTSKFSLPKWELIRDYARTFATNAAIPPRHQTATQQGVFPVITYARMGYNLTCAAAGAPPDLNIMPVVTLWNPYNVKIAAKTYEFCVQYSNISPTSPGTRLTLRTGSYSPTSPTNPALAPEDFDLSLVRVSHGANFNGSTFLAAGNQEYGENTTTTQAEYFRFKLEVTQDMEPGESRIFTICDLSDSPAGGDTTSYKSGVSHMSDVGGLRNDVGVNNAVTMRGQVPFNAFIFGQTQLTYLKPFPSSGALARMEVLLSDPLPSSIASSDTNAVRQFLRANAYQRIVGTGFDWLATMEALKIPPQNTGEPLLYHRIELMMSDLATPFPESNLVAQHNPGAPRWLATLNPQAATFLRKPFVEASGKRSNFNPSYLVENYVKPPNGAVTLTLTKHDIPNADSAGRVSAGTRVSNTSGGAQNLVIREFKKADTPFFSLAQLQHVNTSLINLNPAYAIGNSHANLYVNRNASYTVLTNTDSFSSDDAVASANPGVFPGGALTGFPGAATFNRIYDLSYLLNEALWDGYFFSTIPTSMTLSEAGNADYCLPNSRHAFNWATGSPSPLEITEIKTTDKAAAHLRINGGFNVNSTSVQAWRALLYSHNNVATDPDSALNINPFSRFSTALSAPFSGIKPNDNWMGYRILSDAQIDALAVKIVDEIRARGPFLSLADFVNRRLVSDRTGLSGVLQAAINATTTNSTSAALGLPADSYPRDIKDSTNVIAQDPEQQIVYTGSVNANNTAPDTTTTAASRASATPGYLSQADLLTAIGPSLVARSDTFRIRAYGDVQAPVTGSVESRAWCEVVVQRSTEYLNASSDDSTVSPANLINADNKTFGRRFKIISFRWLSPDDI